MSYSHENAAWFKRLLPVLRVKANVDAHQPCTIQNSKPGTAGTNDPGRAATDGHLPLSSELSISRLWLHQERGTPNSEGAPHKNGESRWWRCFFIVRTSSTTANFSISSIRYLQGARAGGISKKTATGTTRFILSATASKRRLRKRARVRGAMGSFDEKGECKIPGAIRHADIALEEG